jgi:glucose/mannose-6-phosphate isomerase
MRATPDFYPQEMAQAPAPTSSIPAFSSALDDPLTCALDEHGMLARAAGFGQVLRDAWQHTADLRIPDGLAPIRSVVIAGVGGSATGGDYLAALSRCTSPLPVQVVRGFELPDYAAADTFVVCCSHSGDTEETLACFDDAARRGCRLFTITTGGELLRRSREQGCAGVVYSSDAPPRAALPWSLAALLRTGNALGMTVVSGQSVDAAARAHERLAEAALGPLVPESSNLAKALARAFDGRLPLVLAAGHLEPAATRFKNQLAENGKALAISASLPELGHNLVVALDGVCPHGPSTAVVTLESPLYDRRLARRFDAVTAMFDERGVPVTRLLMRGDGVLEDLVEATAWTDFTSCYVALNKAHDPTPIRPIDELKARVARLACSDTDAAVIA